jgi:hypothetical protein
VKTFVIIWMLVLTLTASAQTTVGYTGTYNTVSVSGLHVSGNVIRNGLGQIVPLRGVDKSGTEYECLSGGVFDGPTDQTSINAMLAWAINIVRLPINEQCWLGINGLPSGISSATYQSTIVSYVNLLAANNIAAIIDLQWAAPGTTQSTGLVPMPDNDHAPAFWTSVATTFMGNSTVIFDLFNEPYPDSNNDSTAAWTCILNGGTCPGVTYTAAGMQTLLNAVRATGATNIVMSPGVQYTNTLDQWLSYEPTDSLNNLAASWHSYATEICITLTCWNSQILPVMNSVPLIAGEIGENDCQGVYINQLMPWLDMNAGNYLAWAWDTYDCSSFPSLISDYSGTPTNYGIGFKSHLAALNEMHDTHDFNGDGYSDIAWRDGSGDTAIWLMNGTTVLSSGGIGTVPTTWSIVGQRDFNGDDMADLLWHDTSGNTAIWFMNGTTVASTANVGNIPINWTVVGVADFNGDGLGDLLWRDTSGDVAVWLMSSATVMSSAALGNVPTTWTVVGTGDFNGDGMSDILWRDNLGNMAIWFVNGTTVASTTVVGNVPTTWSVVGTGDFNGDGKSDIAWRDTAGDAAIWLMNGATISSAVLLGTIPTTWSIALVGDYNGDGTSDLLWRDTSGNIAMWFMNGAAVSSTAVIGNIPTNWTVQSAGAELGRRSSVGRDGPTTG